MQLLILSICVHVYNIGTKKLLLRKSSESIDAKIMKKLKLSVLDRKNALIKLQETFP